MGDGSDEPSDDRHIGRVCVPQVTGTVSPPLYAVELGPCNLTRPALSADTLIGAESGATACIVFFRAGVIFDSVNLVG